MKDNSKIYKSENIKNTMIFPDNPKGLPDESFSGGGL